MKSESFAQIRITVAELQHFFLGDCFYWRTLYIVYKYGELWSSNVGD